MIFQSSSKWNLPLLKVQVSVLGEGAAGCAWDEDRRQEGTDAACIAVMSRSARAWSPDCHSYSNQPGDSQEMLSKWQTSREH